jgi:predicted RNA-binding protein YlxR (DUF448 family)
MIRFVLSPERQVVPDLAGRLPGRGMWLSARADVVQAARARAAFARAARGPVVVPPDLTAMVETGLARRIAELLGLARRAGQAVGGFQRARAWLQSGRAALAVQASDASPGERARLLAGVTEVRVTAALPAAALGAVFGRDHLAHIAVAPGRLAEAIWGDCARLAGVTGRTETAPPGAPGREQNGSTDG